MNWSKAVYQLNKRGKGYVLVTLVGVSGSTPRNNGTKMVVAADSIHDTIGGGHLEHIATKFARNMLAENKDAQHIEHFQLGANLGQCCGGTATVLFEAFACTQTNLMVFGAGHVGKALIPILASLPVQVHWVDSREHEFPDNFDAINVNGNVHRIVTDDPVAEIAEMPSNSYFVVMTHNHQLDFDLSQAVLKREDFAYLGLIASDTKWRRFQQRYKHREIPQSLVERMNCPIGNKDVPGKLPMEVAVSIAAEIIAKYQNQSNTQTETKQKGSQKGLSWQTLKPMLFEQNEVASNNQDA